ncbi:MAG: restriction endonuclease subunit S [Gammaproteobacteria bacterium]|nr:MAG: restriction endonuclease subunit S [Gammaproteobacteria bacterium]
MSNNTIGSSCHIATGKLDANQAVEGGGFPFFTCAEFPCTIDSFAFDDDVVLIAGNNARGNFHVSRYSGKFNAYQRTYVLTAKGGFDIDYVYYALKLELRRLREKSQGSQTKFLTMPILNNIGLNNIGHGEQIVISKVLAKLDKKISLNNKINAELEAMAKLIYDYWFVQFDFPDANGKPYKSSGGKMVYNEALKREIPDEWNLMPLEGIVDVISDTVTPSDICSKTAYIGLEHIPRKTIILSDWETAEKVDSNKSKCKKMDILFGKIRPYFHKVGICFVDGITSTDTIVLRAKEKKLQGIALQTVFTEHFVESATNSSTGTKMPRANWTVLKNYKTPMPPNELLCKYQSLFDDIVAKIEVSIYQNKELTELRDWLLPMLMNGQVTVNDS